jgi:hypothetical protein
LVSGLCCGWPSARWAGLTFDATSHHHLQVEEARSEVFLLESGDGRHPCVRRR